MSPGIRLEVLDFGGTGDPLIFLAGLGSSAHVFDEFAPKFADNFHVFALTRRGNGASSQPESGYDTGTLAHDIRTVMDRLGIVRASLVGHSIAGDELTKFAVRYPKRVRKLVYLDAAYDRTGLRELFQRVPVPAPPPMTSADSASPAAVRAYLARIRGFWFPMAEVRATFTFNRAGPLEGQITPARIPRAILQSLEPPAYSKVRAPALAIYAVYDSISDALPFYNQLDASGRAQARRNFAAMTKRGQTERARFRREMARGRVLEVHGAKHFVFISNEEQVARAMRVFLDADMGM